MTKLVSLDIDTNQPMDLENKNFLNPDFVYLPLPKKKTEMKKEKKVKKGTLLFQNTYVPISGDLVNLKKCIVFPGIEVPCLEIQNDFQEKISRFFATRKSIRHLTKDEILESIYDYDLKKKLLKESIMYFVISGIDEDPCIRNEAYIQKMYTKIILEMLEVLLSIFPGSKAIIAIKNTDNQSIVAYHSFLGMFTGIEIRLVEDLYLIGKENFLVSRLHIKEPYVYLKIHELYTLYMEIKKRKPLLEKYITFSGDVFKKPFIINTKLGVKVIDIVQKFYKGDLANVSLYINGIMQGKELDVYRLLVTKELQGVVFMKKEKEKVRPCVKCGRCIFVCPIRSNPLLAYKKGKRVKCISCGLCSYICPSHIPLSNYLGVDENE